VCRDVAPFRAGLNGGGGGVAGGGVVDPGAKKKIPWHGEEALTPGRDVAYVGSICTYGEFNDPTRHYTRPEAVATARGASHALCNSLWHTLREQRTLSEDSPLPLQSPN
jgi:hypothetical protein